MYMFIPSWFKYRQSYDDGGDGDDGNVMTTML